MPCFDALKYWLYSQFQMDSLVRLANEPHHEKHHSQLLFNRC